MNTDLINLLKLGSIVGVLKLSSKYFNTSKKGYILKEFHSIFGLLPTFMVKTNKIKDMKDKYVIVNVSYDEKTIVGTVERYLGDVGDELIEKTMCEIFCTHNWKKIDKQLNLDSNFGLNLNNNLGLSAIDLTPERENLINGMFTVSVDPDGSKDIDDAISIRTLETTGNQSFEIGVHIADPSSYILQNSILDIEAFKRVESVYLQNTFHMFPEHLSTNVFSLIEQQERRAFSVFFTVLKKDDRYTVTKKTIKKTLIKVDLNTTYEKFQQIVNTSCDESLASINMKTLYLIGADLYKFKSDYSSKEMIEVFMILANNAVAESLVNLGSQLTPLLIRSQLDSDSSVELNADLELIKEHIRLKSSSAELKFYDKTRDNKHSSLGLDLYTHFTSPIRRYSDIIVHRTLYNLLTGTNVFNLDNLNTNTLFRLNHYKKFYRNVSRLESDVLMTHDVVSSIGFYPSDRVVHLKGIVMDIINDIVKIKCIGVNDSQIDGQFDNQFNSRLEKHVKNKIHIVKINENKLRLFDEIEYKMCFLQQDVRKIRTYC